MEQFITIQGVKVSTEILTTKFRCDYEHCKGGCCHAHVDDVELWGGELLPTEAEYINNHRDEILNLVDDSTDEETREIILNHPIETHEENDIITTPLRKDGRCVYSCMLSGCCAFAKKSSPMKIPNVCSIYPIDLYSVDGVHYMGMLHIFDKICGDSYKLGERDNTYVYEFCKDSIIRFFGEEFYSQLVAEAKKVQNALSKSKD